MSSGKLTNRHIFHEHPSKVGATFKTVQKQTCLSILLPC